MRVHEISSGKPKAQTFVDDNIYIAIESDNTNVHVDETIVLLVEKLKIIPSPTLPQIVTVIDSIINSFTTTLLVMMKSENELHMVSRGKGTIFLKRGQEVSPLLAENASATGPLEDNDIFILTPPSFLSAITTSVFTILLGKTNDEDVEEQIMSYLTQNAKTNTRCLMVINTPEPQTFPIKEIEPTVSRKIDIKKYLSYFSPFSPQTKQQKLTLVVGILLLTILVGSLVFGSREREKAKIKSRFEAIKTQVASKLKEAQEIVEVNPEQAEPILTSVQTILSSQEADFKNDSDEDKEISSLRSQTEGLINRAHRIYTVEPSVFFDIKWVKETGKGTKLAIDENQLYILDSENKNVYTVGLSQKKADVTATSELFNDGMSVVLFQKKPFIFVEGNDPRIVNEKGQTVIAHNDSWGVIKDSTSYGGNIYLLDRNGALWKYPGSTEGFGSGSNWLNEDVTPDFSQATSMAIDGNIWVISPNTITKLTLGGIDSFFLKGDSLQSAKDIWASENSDYIYVLENNRIVLFNKQGKYYKQYVWDKLSNAQDFVVSESLKKILIVIDAVIYSIDDK